MTPRPFPRALPHGTLREVFPNVFFVTGTIAMPGPVPVRFSRNMTVVREGERLVIINSVRLGDDGLRALDKLGKVTDILRLAGFHGADDPFYRDRYDARVWALQGQRYTAGFDTKSSDTYFEPQEAIEEDTKLPLDGAMLYRFSTDPPEGLLLLSRDGGIVVSGDALQNWATTDEYFSGVGKVMMKMLGFIKPHNVGPGWLKQAKPSAKDLRGVLDLDFENVLPAHGAPVVGNAKAAYRSAIESAASK